ncbi:MAG: EAL domain-containing protein [Sinobacteraceae bacterium]|nr:EAL domain-containing protein [Nevskiaceae bacterium]
MFQHTAPKVLAVDDNATIRKAISLRLGAKGFDVATAVDGEDALAQSARHRFDLVLLDLAMPGCGGQEVLRRLRRHYSATELPIIVLAASNDKADINKSLELGANDYIIKPGELPILLARIRTQLALKDTVARLREHSALMRDMLSLEPAATALLPPAHGPEETEAFIASIEQVHGVPFDVMHDNTPMTCFTLDAEGTVLYANRFGARYLGYQAAELVGRSMLELFVAEDRGLAQESLAGTIAIPGRVHRWDIRHVKKDGIVIWMRNTACAVPRGGRTLVLVTCEDIDDTYKLSELLTFQSTHDEVTGLANRKVLEQRLGQVIDSALAEHTEHALVLLDLDRFTLINEACGHENGDALLRQLAHLLRTIARKRDTIARVGGDKFAVLLEDCPVSAAHTAADALRRAIEGYAFSARGQDYSISASIGIAPIDAACENAGTVMSMAETACHAAKDAGRNCIHVYQSDNAPVVARHGLLRWAARINAALAENRFTLSFQEISPLGRHQGGRHYEILLRMIDEQGATILPGEFLPAAERYQLTSRLDRWVVGRVFAWLELQDAGEHASDLCSVNLSGQSIGNDELLCFILDLLDRTSVPPHKLCFEITETAAVADMVQATRFIERLKERGCRFALDDFGSGFSSLAYLKRLPVDFLKIDGAFVRDITSDSIDLAMVRSINEIGHVMGKQTIAEFVEDAPTLAMLREVGVDFVQGYEVGRPSPLEQFLVLH